LRHVQHGLVGVDAELQGVEAFFFAGINDASFELGLPVWVLYAVAKAQ
jgi:hypothetical protein